MTYLRIRFILFTVFIALIIEGRYVKRETCHSNEVYQACGTACPGTCADPNASQKLCNHMCVIGCFCIDGYVRQNDPNSPCIKVPEC